MSAPKRTAILLVDDEPIILLSLRHELRNELGSEYAYETAASGEEGLSVIRELAESGVKVILVISDWLMPGMKGDEFLSRVRAGFPEVRTIMVSGQANPEDVARIRASGDLDAYFSKPWDPVRLVATCKRLLADEPRDSVLANP